MRISDWSSDVCSSDLSMRPGIFGTAVIADSSVINNNLAPSDFMDTANSRLVNGYAGDITVTGAGPRIHVDHDSTPEEACIDMLKNLGKGRGAETAAVASSEESRLGKECDS